MIPIRWVLKKEIPEIDHMLPREIDHIPEISDKQLQIIFLQQIQELTIQETLTSVNKVFR